jgi:hypothetical protein
MGGVYTSPPDIVLPDPSLPDLHVFALGTDHAAWHTWWDGFRWQGPESLGGLLTSPPRAVASGLGRIRYYAIDVFAIGGDNAVYHKQWHGDTWNDWDSLGGSLFSPVSAVAWAPYRLDVFATGQDNALWHTWLWQG